MRCLPALNVLLVEDIELNVIVARSVLEKLGNSVDVAMTGKAALEMFGTGRVRPGAAGYPAAGYDGTGYFVILSGTLPPTSYRLWLP